MWCKTYEQEVTDVTCQLCSAYCSKRKHDETKATNKIPEKMDKTIWSLNFILPTLPR